MDNNLLKLQKKSVYRIYIMYILCLRELVWIAYYVYVGLKSTVKLIYIYNICIDDK